MFRIHSVHECPRCCTELTALSWIFVICLIGCRVALVPSFSNNSKLGRSVLLWATNWTRRMLMVLGTLLWQVRFLSFGFNHNAQLAPAPAPCSRTVKEIQSVNPRLLEGERRGFRFHQISHPEETQVVSHFISTIGPEGLFGCRTEDRSGANTNGRECLFLNWDCWHLPQLTTGFKSQKQRCLSLAWCASSHYQVERKNKLLCHPIRTSQAKFARKLQSAARISTAFLICSAFSVWFCLHNRCSSKSDYLHVRKRRVPGNYSNTKILTTFKILLVRGHKLWTSSRRKETQPSKQRSNVWGWSKQEKKLLSFSPTSCTMFGLCDKKNSHNSLVRAYSRVVVNAWLQFGLILTWNSTFVRISHFLFP